MEGAGRMLEFFFADGPDPSSVVRRVYAWAKSVRSDLLLNMSHHEIGMLLGEGRAAGSWRVKQIINRRLTESGAKGDRLPWQKSSTACAKYAAAARGNSNRRNGKKS